MDKELSCYEEILSSLGGQIFFGPIIEEYDYIFTHMTYKEYISKGLGILPQRYYIFSDQTEYYINMLMDINSKQLGEKYESKN